MDVRLENGDIRVSDSGSREMIFGLEEAAQRVMLAASVMKGSFIYDRGLGADYSGLSLDDPLLEEKLEMLIREAAAGIADAQVELESFSPAGRIAALRVSRGSESMMIEVDLDGFI